MIECSPEGIAVVRDGRLIFVNRAMVEALGYPHPELASRVIFLTGGAFTVLARDFLDRVPNARLDKPFDSERLRAMVNRQVSRAV